MLLSRPIPLRTTSSWIGYHETRSIPIVIGRCITAPIPYDHERKIWVISDQPILGVDEVRFGADPVLAWTWRNTTDMVAHTIAQIEFSEPVPDGTVPSVKVRGLPDPITGGLLENPATLVWWILTRLAERNTNYHDFDDARIVFANAGLLVGGVLDDESQTVRRTISEILSSMGATWSLNIPGIIRPYPPINSMPTLVARDISDFAATTDFDTIGTRIILNYDKDWAANDTLAAVTVDSSRESQEYYGLVPIDIAAPWLHDTAAATALALRWLWFHSRPLWKYSWKTRSALTPGIWVTVDCPYAPISTAYILGCDYDQARNEVEIQAEAYG